jgi:hypothetical protein
MIQHFTEAPQEPWRDDAACATKEEGRPMSNRYFNLPPNDHEAARTGEKSAYWWCASQDPAAVAWRAQANGEAVVAVVTQALTEYTGAAPVRHLETPPTGSSNYFTVPGQVDGNKGAFFTIPATIIPTEEKR